MLNGSALTHQKLRGYIDAEPMNFSLQYSDHCLERQKTLIPNRDEGQPRGTTLVSVTEGWNPPNFAHS